MRRPPDALPMIGLFAITRRLNENIETLAASLFGEPSQRRGGELRFRSKGSLAVQISGAKRGSFFDFEAGAGGGALELIKIALGKSTAEAIYWAEVWLGMPHERQRDSLARSFVSRSTSADDVPHRIEAARRIWKEGVEISGTPAENYLRRRHALPPFEISDLRFHPACPMGDGKKVAAMVALMRNIFTNEPRAIHRTPLLADGSGKHPIGKKMLGPSKGTAIKFCDDAEVTQGLGIAEGIENALTAWTYGWFPAWAAGDAGAIKLFPVLNGIECLTIFADADDKTGVGLKAARFCAKKWLAAGREATIHIPPNGSDWNDVARAVAA